MSKSSESRPHLYLPFWVFSFCSLGCCDQGHMLYFLESFDVLCTPIISQKSNQNEKYGSAMLRRVGGIPNDEVTSLDRVPPVSKCETPCDWLYAKQLVNQSQSTITVHLPKSDSPISGGCPTLTWMSVNLLVLILFRLHKNVRFSLIRHMNLWSTGHLFPDLV